jgi:aminoglycoside phosphotransferase (APT) family kinase protein
MDLGTTLGYWMSKDVSKQMMAMPFNPKVLMENISRRRLAEIYAEKSGRDLTDILFYYVFGTFKIAVIAQQIYFRFAKGFTQDARFASFNMNVKVMGEIAYQAIQAKQI